MALSTTLIEITASAPIVEPIPADDTWDVDGAVPISSELVAGKIRLTLDDPNFPPFNVAWVYTGEPVNTTAGPVTSDTTLGVV